MAPAAPLLPAAMNKATRVRPIYLLTDYKGHFGEKRYSVPYRSGMDLSALKRYFAKAGFDLQVLGFSDVDLRTGTYSGQYVLYTSSPDAGGLYRSYIEDVCLALSIGHATLIPEYKYLRAYDNKVLMEMLRDLSGLESIKTLASQHYGTLEELKGARGRYARPSVIKRAEGAQGTHVRLARNAHQLLRWAARMSRSRSMLRDLKDFGRAFRHRGYTRESRNRRKFIVQTFIEGLSNDWKILVFGEKYYVLHRDVRTGDFRASGSGRFEFKQQLPDGMLEFASTVFQSFSVPTISMDVAFDGRQFHLIEFQCVHFGSTAIEKAPFYYVKQNSAWTIQRHASILEREYVNSIVTYINQREGGTPELSAL